MSTTTTTRTKNSVKSAQALIAGPIGYSEFLEKLGAKDKLNAEKHVAACETGPVPGHAKLWKRVATTLMTLSSNLAKVNGQQSIQFYVPDGKYRKQVFAMEDLRKDAIHVYCTDVLDEAIKLKLLKPTKGNDEDVALYALPGSGESLPIEKLNGQTANPAEFFKHMIGWHREAIRITLPLNASDAQVDTALTLCALNAEPQATAS
jgi:hypothetical protein